MCGNTWELKFILMMANYSTHIRINVWMINGWRYGKCALYNWDIHLCSEKLISWRSQDVEKNVNAAFCCMRWMLEKWEIVWRSLDSLWWSRPMVPRSWKHAIHHLCFNISFSEDGCKKYCNTKILPLTKVSKGRQPNVINAYNVRLINECIRKCILTKGHCWKGIEEDKRLK